MSDTDREALNDSAYTAIQDGVEPMDWLNRNRDAVLRALGAYEETYPGAPWVRDLDFNARRFVTDWEDVTE